MMWDVADRISSIWSFCTLVLVCWRQIMTCVMCLSVFYFAHNSAALILTKTKQISVFKQKQKETPEQKKKKE